MLKSEINPQTEYALREKRISGTPFQRIRIIQHIRGNKWKAEWIDPNPGLVHYVESGQLICLWKEHKAFLKEESEAQRLLEHNEHHGYIPGSPLTKAVEQVSRPLAIIFSSTRASCPDRPMRWSESRCEQA